MWYLKEILKLGGKPLGDYDRKFVFKGFSIDSRKISPGEVFVPLKGEHFDGADFVGDALERGAVGFLWDRDYGPPDFPLDAFVIRVRDSLEFLRKLARYRRRRFRGKVFGITGSAGKTTTKEFLGNFLRYILGEVELTPGGLNSQIGLPLSITSFKSGDGIWVVEMGISMPGEMDRLVEIARPDISIITAIGESHLEFLGSVEGVFEEKWKITRFSKALVLGFDLTSHELADVVLKKINSFMRRSGAKVFFPKVHGNSVEITLFPDEEVLAEFSHEVALEESHDGLKVVSHIEMRLVPGSIYSGGLSSRPIEFEFPVGIFGDSVISSLTVAVSASIIMGLPLRVISQALKSYAPEFSAPGGRFRIFRVADFIIVDDSYNSNPVSLRNSVKVASLIASKYSIPLVLVLGDMLELGENSPRFHSDFSDFISGFPDIKSLYTVGRDSVFISHSNKVGHFGTEDIEQLLDSFLEHEKGPALVLVKASRGIALDRFVSLLRDKLLRKI